MGNEAKVYRWIAQMGNFGLQILWHLIHAVVSIWYFALSIANLLESCLISSGLLKRYESLNLGKLRYLAIVIESEEARHTSKVIELLQRLAAMGMKRVCLYDMDGVLKKSKEVILERLSNAESLEATGGNDSLLNQDNLTLEFASFSDGKEAVAKAANVLFAKYKEAIDLGGEQEEPVFTEPQMSEALKSIGCVGPDPDLLLVYGPARCHLGFPAWRIRYTEIVHMGPLMSMKYGSLVKAIYKFTMVRQNFGK